MYHSVLTALQFSSLLLLTVHGLSAACTHGICSPTTGNNGRSESEEDSALKPTCMKELYSPEKYPYLAMASYKCDKGSGEELAVIISDRHALLHTPHTVKRDENCTFGLLAGSDQFFQRGTKHEAEYVKIGDKGELTLLKLKTAITSGPHAEFIPLALTKPKSDDQALFITWIFNSKTLKDEGVFASNVTLLDQTECRKMLPQNLQATNQSKRPSNSFCINSFKNPCLYHGSAVLIANGQLAGISNGAYKTTQEVNSDNFIHTFFNVAQYNAAITNHM